MRLIDADDIHNITVVGDGGGRLKRIDAPTIDAVPVVRCRECMYSAPIVDAITHERNGFWCAILDLENVEEDFYCKDGQRREDGDA